MTAFKSNLLSNICFPSLILLVSQSVTWVTLGWSSNLDVDLWYFLVSICWISRHRTEKLVFLHARCLCVLALSIVKGRPVLGSPKPKLENLRKCCKIFRKCSKILICAKKNIFVLEWNNRAYILVLTRKIWNAMLQELGRCLFVEFQYYCVYAEPP